MIRSNIAQEVGWRKAEMLTERVENVLAGEHGFVCPKETAHAQRKLAKWKSQPPFNTEGYFARRLAADQISESQLFNLFEPSSSNVNASASWLDDLIQAFAQSNPSTSFSSSALPYFQENAGFLGLVQGVVDQAMARFRAGMEKLRSANASLPFDPEEAPSIFFPSLAARLVTMLNRTMILELNVARLEEELQGETAEARFQSFLDLLRNEDIAWNLLLEYPVLARQIMLGADQWLAFSLEFLQALSLDWNQIQRTFSPRVDIGLLADVKGNLGDRHRNGRSVLVCKFSSGAQLVYKPRSLALDRHFQDLANWAGQYASLQFRNLKILDHESYGWIEFVEPGPCDTADGVQRFYERQGAYLALLFVLEASDFHFENVIAAGEHPILIDLEALFHPRIQVSGQAAVNESMTSELDYSVLRVGMLPQRVFGPAEAGQENAGSDTSGIGGSGGNLTPTPVPWLEAVGTDAMHITRKRVMMPHRDNRPSLPDGEIKVQDFENAIVAGFTRMYEALLQHREELLSNNLLSQFADDHVRVVLRPTEVYAFLLRESFHPDFLRDALDRDRFLDYLWAAVPECPQLERVIASERGDLWNGDVPIFTTTPSSCDLWNSADLRFEKFFSQSGLDRVKTRLASLSLEDLRRQIWFIRASLASLRVDETHSTKASSREVPLQQDPITAEQLIEAAEKVGDRLNQLALWSKDEVSWVGVGLVNERAWSLLPLGNKFYDGLPGVLLFLAYLGSVTQKDKYTLSAKAALRTLLRQYKTSAQMNVIGAFSGLGGIAYVLYHLSALWNDQSLLGEAEEVLEMLPPLIDHDDKLDIMAGAAGCLAALLACYHLSPSKRMLAIAKQCGDHLIAKARPMQRGKAWVVSGVATVPLTGFSHGASGIAWALTELASLTGEERYHQTVTDALEYERSLFVPEQGNWPDLRHDVASNTDPNSIHCGMMWCHGAPGIALARLLMLRHLDETVLREEAVAALGTTLREGFGANHCLCHGDLGNLEIILQASLVLDNPAWKNEVDRLTATVFASIEHNGWLCGTPGSIETPGLLTGIAGIGMQLLRLANPSQVPSVLCLQPPTPCGEFLAKAATAAISEAVAGAANAI